MSDVYRFIAGSTPLLISVPHDGWQIPNSIVQHMADAGRAIPDTDWHVSQLYEFATDMGAALLLANYSRYVVDLNRPPDDASLYADRPATGLVPTHTFAGEPIYLEGSGPGVAERVREYWRPYHDKLERELQALRDRHGFALLWDAHSIPSRVPSLFDGELPTLNLGAAGGSSCAPAIAAVLMEVAEASPYSAVLDGRFQGGYITRHYGDPDKGVHALQLELAQNAYMNEKTLEFDRAAAAELTLTLRALLHKFQDLGRDIQTVFI